MIGSNLYSFTAMYGEFDRTARHSGLMSEHQGNVVTLPRLGRAEGRPSGRPEALWSAVSHLDELSRRLEQLSPHATWSARRWMIASTPFRMRLVGTRSRLAELMTSWPVSAPYDGYWLLDLEDAFRKIQRRLHDLDACLRTLQHAETSPADRSRETEAFLTRRSELAEVATRIRYLIAQRFPESSSGR
jgi:hypothetical protein